MLNIFNKFNIQFSIESIFLFWCTSSNGFNLCLTFCSCSVAFQVLEYSVLTSNQCWAPLLSFSEPGGKGRIYIYIYTLFDQGFPQNQRTKTWTNGFQKYRTSFLTLKLPGFLQKVKVLIKRNNPKWPVLFRFFLENHRLLEKFGKVGLSSPCFWASFHSP
jgi:hypothetical protein